MQSARRSVASIGFRDPTEHAKLSEVAAKVY